MKFKVQFKGDSGVEVVATFDQATGTVSAEDGRKGTYVRNGAVLEIKGEEDAKIVFDSEPKLEVGASTRFTGPQGPGTATILSAE